MEVGVWSGREPQVPALLCPLLTLSDLSPLWLEPFLLLCSSLVFQSSEEHRGASQDEGEMAFHLASIWGGGWLMCTAASSQRTFHGLWDQFLSLNLHLL